MIPLSLYGKEMNIMIVYKTLVYCANVFSLVSNVPVFINPSLQILYHILKHNNLATSYDEVVKEVV
ncbi:hypothetical protein BME96_18215 [Virgibacillus halodenitrificans]|uniref:Uncharacterized protein n=1 Tax=Virgibacillus halodenitrificans TaxID=1482 RepID=A0AAC9NMH1_VIRHA|nr:hypothetical protein BME96_18215 [Virgibacillus halodenitrificans]